MGAPVVMIGTPDMMGAAAAAEEVMMGTPVVVAGVYALMPPVVMMGVAVVDGTVMIGGSGLHRDVGSDVRDSWELQNLEECCGEYKLRRNDVSKQMCLKCRFKQAFKQLYQCKYPLLT